jgi:hypothetical protein
MRFQQLLDSLPIVAVFVAFALAALLVSEGGFRVGRWWQNRTPEEKEGPTAMIVGSLLALLAFLLAVSMGMAADRFDTRRGLVLAEANALGTTYLRAGYLPEPASIRIRGLLREYVPLRVLSTDPAGVQGRIARSVELHADLWSIAEELARISPESDALALFIESLNQVIDLHESRITVGIYGRVPETVIILLFLSSMLTLGMVGYSAGLSRRRSPLTAVVMIIVLGAVLTLVVDLDRPREGFLTVNDQPLIDLSEQIGAASAPATPSE